jgi:threonyl-tRNA synthetase
MMEITLKDGSTKMYEGKMTVLDIAKDISQGLARVATSALVNDEVRDLRYTITTDSTLSILTFENGGKDAYRHTTAHILAQAVKRLYPSVKLAIGPSIEMGFYYDFDIETPFTSEDLEKIESEMNKIIKEKLPIERFTLPKNEAIELMQKGQALYKVELIQELPDEEEISFYKQGDFIDLCAGPHLMTTAGVKSVKLLQVAGAYWKGNEKNKMLQRIYGISFPKKSMLDEHIERLEEAKKRDHRKLGKELDLFCFSDLLGPGLPLFTPKGVIIKELLQKSVEEICRGYGYQKVSTPHLANIKLFETSGHAAKFPEELFHVTSEKGHDYVLKPVQCPGHTQIYASRVRSYKNLPIRYMESEKQYRAEKSGEISGLSRVYAITCEDGHSFCTVDQVKQEVINLVNIIKNFYTQLGLWDNHWISLSVRDPKNTEKYIGTNEDWETCESMLQEVSDELGLNARRCEGEAALYGPKLDFIFFDAMGREIQIPTVQLDFATPKRFNLVYIDSNGDKVNPVMVHRAILGSYERFMVLLIEHFAGAFPVWLAPVQARILPIVDKHHDYSLEVQEELAKHGIRVEVDTRAEKIGYKIRETQLEKVPYMLVVGDNEVSNNAVSVRTRKDGDIGSMAVSDFVKRIVEEVGNKVV